MSNQTDRERFEAQQQDHPYSGIDRATGEYKPFDQQRYEKKLARAVADHDIEQPDDLVNYPNQGLLSRFGKDKGAKRRPMVQVEVVDADSNRHVANRVRDSLATMRDQGRIDDKMLTAARYFQQQFDKCGYEKYTSVNLEAAGGGGMSFEEILHRSRKSRDYVSEVMHLLGGNTPMSRVVFYMVGLRWNADYVANQWRGHKQYWVGVLHSALTIIAMDFEVRRQSRQGVSAFLADGDVIY